MKFEQFTTVLRYAILELLLVNVISGGYYNIIRSSYVNCKLSFIRCVYVTIDGSLLFELSAEFIVREKEGSRFLSVVSFK